ncbi:MAG: pyruvate formate-lyase activating enzyme [Deltaproteobacteria bacterium]|nr:MAG: pyruvate formate-lyase activating enzyme [Deltaproteobacteria bacterium]
MSRFLMVDIGAGTMDVLYYDTQAELHFKAVVQSPVRQLAEAAARLPGNLLITGHEMGGGPITSVLRERSREKTVVMSASAAATLHHDLALVRSWGIRIVADQQAEELKQNKKYSHLKISDLDEGRLERIVKGFGVPFSFDAVGICAQDHGVPPAGVSHLDYRHNLFTAILNQKPFPDALLYKGDEVPATMNRLTAIAKSAAALAADEIYVMDSGMAAILGATMDVFARQKEKTLLLDVATSHTVGAAMESNKIAGFFEYHTVDITLDRLEALLQDLTEGRLKHDRILREGGHGAYTRKAYGFKAVEVIIATGPKRKMVANSQLPIVFGAPLGDNMMTGTVGLLEAIRRRKGLEPIIYL